MLKSLIMRAMRLEETKAAEENPLTLREMVLPEPEEGQIRLRVLVCGVCHTDLHTVEGDLTLPKLPVTPGHQIVATVDKLGPKSHRFEKGERVGVAWLNWACGACGFCKAGLENLCENARFTGLHADGGYAQYTVVDEAFVFPVPKQFSDEAAAPLLCAGIVGFRSLRLSSVQHGDKLGLYGFGASAHLVIQVAVHWGCEVYVFTRGDEHRRLAKALGAAWVGEANDSCPAALDGSILFAPAGWIVPVALGHLRPGGTLAINAIHMSPIPEMPYQRIYGERILRSVANFTRSDAREFLQLAADIPVRAEVELFRLSEANEVLQRMKRSELKAAAVLRIEG
jgi:propanol-preferring alcohol dehydrogenase